MELLTASDLFVTASLALLLSVLVAKLVCMAMASDHNTHEPVITLQQERLTVQKRRSERRVEFIDPIQVSTNVETEQTRVREEQDQDDEDDEENKVESNFFELDSVALEDIPVEFDVSKVSLLREEQVAEEEEEVTENNEESEEQRKTECVEDCKEQSKTEEITFEASSQKENENQGKTEEISIKTSSLKEIEQQKKIEGFKFEEKDIKESEEQRETDNIEDFREQGKTEESTMKPFDIKERNDDDGNIVVDDDDWEGIERSDLEKLFMMATEFVVGSDSDGLESDLQMELYGLHKIATEGPCRESQPMPLKINARAKWNAWQKLGNMSPDVAMERYIGLLSDKVPGWMKDSSSAGLSEYEQKGSEVSESFAPDLNTSLSHQQMIINERELEQESGVKDHCTVKETDLENSAKK